MNTFSYIVGWEVRFYLRRISTWVYFGILGSLSFLMMLVLAGAFSSISGIANVGGKVYANSPFTIATLLPTLALFGISIVAAVAGHAIYRDYDARMDPLVYTTPVSKRAFLAGRFTGTLIVNTIILLGLAVGAILATISPWAQADKLTSFSILSYVQTYGLLIVPNMLFTAAIFFALPALTRQMLPNYVGGVMLFIGYLISGSLLRDIGNKHIAALIDPFGGTATGLVTQYWSIAEKNVRHLPLGGVLAENRAIWLAVGFAIFALAYHRFQFAHAATERRGRAEARPEDPVLLQPVRLLELPAVRRSFDARARLTQYASLTARSFWRVVRSVYFYAIVAAAVIYLGFAASQIGKLFGTTTWPVTYEVVGILGDSFGLFMLIIVAFYAGELVWTERDAKIDQLTDAAPTTTAITLLAKLTALVAVIVVLLAVVMLTGIVTQAIEGYYRFELPLYFQTLFGIQLADILLIAVLTFTVHVMVNNKYMGHLVVFLVFISFTFFNRLGLEHNLYQYASDGGTTYSDMNRWGPFVRPFVYWKLYWYAFAVLLTLGVNLLWVRGGDTDMSWRLRLARARFGRGARTTAALAGLSFAGFGGFIFYNTNVLNDFTTRGEIRHRRAELERKYKRYEHVPQPRITAVQVKVDLFPAKQDMRVQGHYVLRNKTRVPIDTIHLRLSRELKVTKLAFDRPTTAVLADSAHEYFMHRLATPLAPGDSVVMNFDMAAETRGFSNTVDNTEIVSNGTFVENAQFMPSIGYSANSELADDDDRKQEKLKPKSRMRPPMDQRTWADNYISADADWLDYDAIVSTDPDQIAITSGYLQREWTENGRRYFHYKMDAPILNLWAFQSARYALKTDRWLAPDGRTIDIAVYYHPTHTYNVARMVEAVKKSLAYYTENFGPYQHRQVRIVEFPRYATFAQSLPNTIPYSESVGFIARVEDSTAIDYPFYVTAHEVAHQWWAHQVIGADAQGSTLLSETLAQYSALMVMEKEFGPTNMRRFLEYELDQYLIGRSAERKKEMPLELGENQPYIHYNKGSLITYALKDYLGEARMNGAIRGFLQATKFRGPPYPTSLQLVDSLRAATPDSLKYLIADFFETITLYELKADSATVGDSSASGFQVNLYVTAKKLRADSLGRETEIPMKDWVDVGVYTRPERGKKSPDKDGVPIYLEKHRIHEGAQRITVTVSKRPTRAGVDPLHKLIDRQTTDNTIGVQDRRTKQ
jgi:hypothetical protein